jgi:hypothetical protein
MAEERDSVVSRPLLAVVLESTAPRVEGRSEVRSRQANSFCLWCRRGDLLRPA